MITAITAREIADADGVGTASEIVAVCNSIREAAILGRKVIVWHATYSDCVKIANYLYDRGFTVWTRYGNKEILTIEWGAPGDV